MTTDVMKWLEEARGLKAELLWDMGVKPVPAKDGQEPAVAFPYRRRGDTYAWKFRTPGKRFWSTKDVTRGLFNEDALLLGAALPVVITEGEIDALSCIAAGFDRAVSVPDGWGESKAEDAALVAAEKGLRDSPRVIVAGDNDEAGAGLPRYVANLLKGHDVRHAVWPEGCKDANDVLVKFGPGEVARCLNEARRLDPPGGLITGFSDLPPLGERRVLRMRERPFDYAVALEVGALSVWTGIPGSGKSTFLIFAADRITQAEGVRAGLLMFETHPHAVREQLALMRTGQSYATLPGDMRRRFLEDVDRRFRMVHYRPEGDIQQTMGWLEAMIHTLAVRDGCKLIVIDPWNELEHLPNPGESMTSYINWATKTLRQWAEQLGVHIALVAHPRKMPTEGTQRPPTGYDIADSSAFFNKPSLGVTVHQKFEKQDEGPPDKWVEVNVWKVRDTLLYGFEKGRINLDFDPTTKTYRERPKDAGGDE